MKDIILKGFGTGTFSTFLVLKYSVLIPYTKKKNYYQEDGVSRCLTTV